MPCYLPNHVWLGGNGNIVLGFVGEMKGGVGSSVGINVACTFSEGE